MVFTTYVFCTVVAYLAGGPEYGAEQAPVIGWTCLKLIPVFWLVFLMQLYSFNSDDIDPEEEDDTLDEEEGNVSSWEDEGGAI